MSKLSEKAELKNQAIETLRKMLKAGDTVYTVVTKASSNGMSRQIKAFVVRGAEISNISWEVGQAIGHKIGSCDGVVMAGCGMDMGFKLVYNLGSALGLEAVDGSGSRDPGFSLKQRWL